RARGVGTVAIAGVATSAMVAATCYDAADRDYHVAVLRDGCGDADPAMHEFFMHAVFPSRGVEVTSRAAWPGATRRSPEGCQPRPTLGLSATRAPLPAWGWGHASRGIAVPVAWFVTGPPPRDGHSASRCVSTTFRGEIRGASSGMVVDDAGQQPDE